MANQYRDRVWRIDTASATAITTDMVDIEYIRWLGATDAGHTAIIQDGDGEEIWRADANSTDYSEESAVRLVAKGLIVPTLGSGVLFLYHKL